MSALEGKLNGIIPYWGSPVPTPNLQESPNLEVAIWPQAGPHSFPLWPVLQQPHCGLWDMNTITCLPAYKGGWLSSLVFGEMAVSVTKIRLPISGLGNSRRLWGVEQEEGRVWGRKGPQWGNKAIVASKAAISPGEQSLEFSCNSGISPVPTLRMVTLLTTKYLIPESGFQEGGTFQVSKVRLFADFANAFCDL